VRPELVEELTQIIRHQLVSIQFQPIVHLGKNAIGGYEALSRGPSDSAFHSPLVLFEAAANAGLIVELELMVMQKIVVSFMAQDLPGRLFLNITVDTLLELQSKLPSVLSVLADAGLDHGRLVVELTETRPVLHLDDLEGAVQVLNHAGIAMALDDLGEGFASLKRWLVMKPAFVKIDRHFVDGIHRDPVKQQFIKSIVDIARVSASAVIAEGLEDPADLHTVVRLGIAYAQGYLTGKPETVPRKFLAVETTELVRRLVDPHPVAGQAEKPTPKRTAADLLRAHPFVRTTDTIAEITRLFRTTEGLNSLPVLAGDGQPVGLVRSLDFLALASKPYFHEVYSRKSCVELMSTDMLCFDSSTDLRTVSERTGLLDDRHLVDGFLIIEDGVYKGMGRTTDLIRAVSEMQVFAARYANPLTFLPGNVPIDERIHNLLNQKVEFTVAYWDLNDFKPYNDVYGYAAGDEIIKLTARLLESHHASQDFLGHIGGDDFITVFLSNDWEQRVQETLRQFGEEIVHYLEPAHLGANGYQSVSRKGQLVHHALLSLSAGILPVRLGSFTYASEVSQAVSAVKKEAKRLGGNAYFVEKRRPASQTARAKSSVRSTSS
jgi:diguanylate cyclase (GGDEF)-like protein